MCGRYTLRTPAHVLAQVFGSPLPSAPLPAPRYNIAPTQDVLAVRLGDQRQREFALLRWGLIPAWAKDASGGAKLINARAETVRREKPAFREAFEQSRCLIPADGFFEWRTLGGIKHPLFITRRDGRPFAFAGLWRSWQRDARRIESCAIITTAANPFMLAVHDRMPVVVSPGDYDRWLTADTGDAERLLQAGALDGDAWMMFPVSRLVNSPGADMPACVTPAPPATLF